MEKRVIEVDERLPLLPTIPLSLQHLFAMFGSTVLVPFLLHVDPATCLFMNGIGTLLYLFIYFKIGLLNLSIFSGTGGPKIRSMAFLVTIHRRPTSLFSPSSMRATLCPPPATAKRIIP